MAAEGRADMAQTNEVSTHTWKEMGDWYSRLNYCPSTGSVSEMVESALVDMVRRHRMTHKP